MKILAPVTALLLLAASPVAAKSLAKPPARLDPAMAYVLVEVGNLDGQNQKGVLTLARWDTERKDVALLSSAKGKPQLAHEATAKAIVQEKKRRLYLIELLPGQWVVEGANGTAFSLGARSFALAAGTVTDLGVAAVTTDYAEGEEAYKLTAGKALKLGLLGAFAGGSAMPQPIPKAVTFRARSAGDLMPPKLPAAAATVTWDGEFKFGNHLGGLVNRMGGRKARTAAAEAPAAASATPLAGER